nr:MAG TPA: hypothetical protein [Caudoviricetes sp.]
MKKSLKKSQLRRNELLPRKTGNNSHNPRLKALKN